MAQEKPAIKVGAISSITGPASFPESAAAAKAYFDRINLGGGVGGRRIEYLPEDDKADPSTAAQAARKLVEDEGVVANVASASVLECAVNASYYLQKGIVSITGTGVDPQCFNSANISPVNTGPYVGFGDLLYYETAKLKVRRPCAVLLQLPGILAGYEAILPRWEAASGKKLTYVDYSYKPGDDPTPFILKAKASGCQAVLFSGIEPMVVAWMNAVNRQHLGTSVKWTFLTPPYTTNVAKVLGSNADGILVAAEFEPWSGESAALADWRKLLTAANVPLTSFAEGGYLAAKIFVDTIKGIKGEITRESVTTAFKELKPITSPMIGSKYTFGPGVRHSPNQTVKIMTLLHGKWTEADPAWVALP